MDKKVIVCGHICLDITPVFNDDINKTVAEVLIPGKLIETKAAKVNTGGAVANTGLAMKLLGADVKLMGKIAKDSFGDIICNILHRYDADEYMIRTTEDSSSYSIVVALPGQDRIFLHNPGANNTFTSSDINFDLLNDATLFHFGYPPIMKMMYENKGLELITLFKKVKDKGCATSLDMAAIDPNSNAGKANWISILKNVMPYVDFFVPSIEELCYMLDNKLFYEWQNRANGKDLTEVLDLDKDIKPLVEKCMKLGCKVLLLKCGARGLYLRTSSKEDLCKISSRLNLNVDAWSNKDIFEKSFKPERVLSATGAGDTSIAAFLTAILNEYNPEESIKLAAATGACCVTEYDALSGLKPFDELKTKIQMGWEKN